MQELVIICMLHAQDFVQGWLQELREVQFLPPNFKMNYSRTFGAIVHSIPQSRKLLGETFMNFIILQPLRKFLHKILGMPYPSIYHSTKVFSVNSPILLIHESFLLRSSGFMLVPHPHLQSNWILGEMLQNQAFRDMGPIKFRDCPSQMGYSATMGYIPQDGF